MISTQPILTLALLATGVFAVAAAPEPPSVAIPAAREILSTLRREHPRLLATAEDFDRLKQEVRTHAQPKKWFAAIQEQGRDILAAPPSKYEIPDGLRLLSTSRRVLYRVQTLGLLYRITGERVYLERAWRELEAAAAFKDWNPRHFLDTAEMTHAFAIGYDWFFQGWTPGQRSTIRAALVDKGLQVALNCYRGTARYGSWMKARHNWNQVCNGGIGMGALAVADELPELAGEFLHLSLQSLQLPMAEFGPDGAWNEGPGYWNYATTYNIAILAALHSALGTDFGLSTIPGFAEAGLFPIYATGPMDRTFNYADAGSGTIRAPHMFWMGRHFKRPEYAEYQLAHAAPHALDLVWFYAPPARGFELPLHKYFRGSEVAMLRSAWNDSNALFVGFKAGDNKANHSNLDLGSFVLDALGVRWVVDLGADNYNLPGYFGAQRWNYYRLRAEGHNTLVLNPGPGPDQDPKAATRIVRFEPGRRRAFAIADLTPAYAAHATAVRRGVSLLDRRMVRVQDEITTLRAADVWSFLHTEAAIEIDRDGRTAFLRQGENRLWAAVVSPAGAAFTAMKPEPLPGAPRPDRQAENKGVRKLAIHLPESRSATITVLLAPLRPGEKPPAELPEQFPLDRW